MSEHVDDGIAPTPRRRSGRQGAKRISWDLEGIRSVVDRLRSKFTDAEARKEFSKAVANNDGLRAAVDDYTYSNAVLALDRESRKDPPPPPPPAPASPEMMRAMLGRIDIIRSAVLQKYKIDGTPIGKCTGATVRASAAIDSSAAMTSKRNAAFKLAISDGVGDEETIETRRGEDEAARLYALIFTEDAYVL